MSKRELWPRGIGMGRVLHVGERMEKEVGQDRACKRKNM